MTTELRMGIAITAAIAALGGCVYEAHDAEEPPTKEEARASGGKDDRGDDLCDRWGWYGDAVCDDFCPEPDPDCATCAAVPSCADGETEHASVSDCPADTSCREVTLCGATIWCSSGGTCSAPNPQGCAGTGCAEGFHCDTSMGTAPSACACDPESGTWTCTADLSGGVCVPD